MQQPRRVTERRGLGCVVPRHDRRVYSRNLASDFVNTSVDDEMTLISVSLHRGPSWTCVLLAQQGLNNRGTAEYG